MKNLLLALCLAAPAFGQESLIIVRDNEALARQRALRSAVELRQTLEEIRRETDRVSDQARKNGNLVRARRFAVVSLQAGDMARDLRRTVIRPLRQGQRLRAVARNVDALVREARRLGEAVADINLLPRQIERDIARATLLLRQLRQILN